MTAKLRSVLTTIFTQYSTQPDAAAFSPDSVRLRYPEAARLWYRCGLKLSALDSVLRDRPDNAKHVVLKDFLSVIESVFEDEKVASRGGTKKPTEPSCQVGDQVELVEGYAKYGDASSGPLLPGDRGVVVELHCDER